MKRKRVDWESILGYEKVKLRSVSWRKRTGSGLLCLGIYCGYFLTTGNHTSTHRKGWQNRHLLASSNGTVEFEQCHYENAHFPVAWVLFYTFIVLVTFIALAIICDDFFVPSLEVISEKLELSEDVAGATFMAAGSSAPELFTSIVGVALESDVGVGTIVGSAVFNILIIVAMSGVFAGQILWLDWRPIARDGVFYAISIACFIGFVWDSKFSVIEAVMLVALYAVYIIVMKLNPYLMDALAKCCGKSSVLPLDITEVRSDGFTQESSCVTAEVSTHPVPATTSKQPKEPQKDFGSGTTTSAGRQSAMSARSTSGTEENKHIFHHVKHGEISGQFITDHHHHPHFHYEKDHMELLRRNSLAIGAPVLSHVLPGEGPSGSDGSSRPGSLASIQGRKRFAGPGAPIPEETDADSNKKDISEEIHVEAAKSFDWQHLCFHEEEEPEIKVFPCLPGIKASAPEKDEDMTARSWVLYFFHWILFAVSFPFVCAFTWTIPDCSKEHNKKWFWLSFLISVIWIGILSFAMVAVVGRAGCLLQIDAYTMGLVVIAIGTSVPDCLSSILVARDGYGDMAVSNAIGSNVFDINLGLGLPFVLRMAIDQGNPIKLLTDEEQSLWASGQMAILPHVKFGVILLLILVICQLTFVLAKFKLNKIVSAWFVFVYVSFLIYAFVQEIYCSYDC